MKNYIIALTAAAIIVIAGSASAMDDKKVDRSHGHEHDQSECPLTIDFLGNGIKITPYAESNAHFDLGRDGVAEKTAWVSGEDDAIVLIKTDKGYDFFGGKNLDGFTDLGNRVDSNHDNVVDARDTDFSKLMLWIDANQDGTIDAAELHTFQEYSVAAINVESLDIDVPYGTDAYLGNVGSTIIVGGSKRYTYAVFYTNPKTLASK